MDFMQLQYFKTTAKTEHITRAAKELNIPQPYLSQVIKKLEKEIGVNLFDRIGKRIILNDAGKILLKHTDKIFIDLNNAMLELDNYRSVEKQDINVAFQCASMLIPQLVMELTERNPWLNFSVYQLHQELDPSIIDITIYSSDKKVPEENECFLLKEELLLALPRTHHLSNKGEITMEDLQNEKFISLSKESNLYKILIKYYEQKNIRLKPSIYLDNPSVMREMLMKGLGISVIPSITWHNITQKDILLRSIKDCKMERYIYLAWNKDKYRTESVKNSIEHIIHYFKNLT